MVNFEFSYFADTFLLEDPTPSNPYPRWKQVLTRGFPSYRAQAKLHSDRNTGNIYLYGGYINSLYAPNRKSAIAHAHSDLWRLRLDLEGGGFENVDWADESRTARPGPWQRCFSCGKIGQWKKCGGSCAGIAHFCNADCLKAGWKEHKVTETDYLLAYGTESCSRRSIVVKKCRLLYKLLCSTRHGVRSD